MALPHTRADSSALKKAALSNKSSPTSTPTKDSSNAAELEETTTTPATTTTTKDTSGTSSLKIPPISLKITREKHIRASSLSATDSSPSDEPSFNSDCQRASRSRSESRGRRSLRCTHFGCKFSTTVSQEFTHHQNTAHTEERDRETLTKETTTTTTPLRRSSTRHTKRASSTSTPVAETQTKSPPQPPAAKNARLTPSSKKAESPLGSKKKLSPNDEISSVVSPEGDSASGSAIVTAQTEEEESATQALLSLTSCEFTPSTKSTAPNNSDPQGVAESATAVPLTAAPSIMISNSRGSSQPLDSSISGASDDENDMNEDGGGRLIIDDTGISTSAAANSGSAVVPTRCGNIQNRTYMCDECSYTTNSAQQSLRHQKEEHGHDFIIYECDICDYATRYKQKLPRHYKLHFPGAGSSSSSVTSHDASQNSDTSLSPHPSLTSSANPTVTSTPVPSVSAVAPIAFPTGATPIISAATPPSNKRTATDAGFVALQALPSEVILEDGEDDELDDEDDDVSPPEGAEGGDNMAVMMSAAPPAKKKRKDVSPDKYFEVAEEVASTKYGCAKCGNVYKWKKSLNKHWKEKHGTDPGDQSFTPPGMEILLQQNNHTQTEHRRCCHNNLLERITVKQGPLSHSSSRAPTPQNFLNGHYNSSSLQHGGQEDEMDGASPGYIPAGPFVLGTSQPVFPGNAAQSLINSLNGPIPSSTKVLDLSTHNSSTPTTNINNNSSDGIDEPDSVDPDDAANAPLDFSVQRGNSGHVAAATPPQGMTSLFHHSQEATAEEDEEVIALDQLAQSSTPGKDILKCPKCGEVLKTQTAYSNHMAMHLHSSNKRVAKCGVCCKHFPNNDLLNTHFMDNHIDLIASHKEAIQKIPHGLQQTYHLLKMPIQNIPKLSSQEAEDPLKCNMCDFTAKWPAELQKHAVSHSDERPFVCMVCGSTYKWKWDLVKHFEKAHSNLPNPYKRRDNGNISGSQSANSELQASGVMASGSQDGYEMEEGEIAPTQIKMQTINGNSVDVSNSFLFDQTSSQDDISVENILRTSEQANLMMRNQPNFLDGPDGPDDPQRSASCSPSHSDREGLQITDVRSLRGMTLPTTPTHSHQLPNDLPQHSRAGPVRQALARNIRSRHTGPSHPYSARGTKPGKGAYKGYKTVENSESSDLKYQCILCDYKARWPSEIMQHMKNHSSEKPYGCPNCSYRSKWKWDVVKHLKRCGGGTIKDVLDYTSKPVARDAPPNVMVTPEGSMVQSQQVVSPSTSTTAADDSNPASIALPGVVSSNSGQPSSSFLPAPFMVSMPTAAAAATAYTNAQAMVNAHMLLQHFRAANDTSGSATVTAESSDQSQSPSPPSPPGSSSQEESTEHQQQDLRRQQQPQQSAPVVFNSLINEGQHHCLLCTFVANSPAELRRHQVLHSDEKPFMCDECGYCTKWKCDMKKHKEKYKHLGPIKYTRPGGSTEITIATQDSNKSDEGKCHLCSFDAGSKDALQAHIKKFHTDRAFSSSSSSSGKKSPSRRKFQCKICPFTTNELGDWVNHLRKHKGEVGVEESRQSPTPNGAPEMDEARLKHPRKAVKKYVCPKCDFVCVKSTELLEHQKQAHGTHRCPFCSQSFDKKDVFLEHLITHPEFNPKEWEHFFMVGSDNEDDENNNRGQAEARQAASTSMADMGSSANTINLNSSSSTRNSPAHDNLHSSNAPDTGLPCDWCKARFPNARSLIEHAMSTHSSQMHGQETAEIKSSPSLHRDAQTPAAAGDKSKSHSGKKGNRTPTPPSKLNGQLASNMDWSSVLAGGMLNAPTLVAQLGQPKVVLPSQQHSTTSSSSSSTKQEMVLNLSKNTVTPDQTTALTCTKCSFKTRDMAKLQQHFQEHVAAEKQLAQMRQSRSKEQLRCWFCSVKVASHLEQFQHMEEKHPELFKQHQTQKEALIQKIVQEVKILGKQSTVSAQRGKPAAAKSQTAKATSLLPAVPLTSQQHPRAGSHAGLDQDAVTSLLHASKVPSTWLHERKVTTYNGLPVTLVNNGKEQWYKCVMCSVTYSSPAQVCMHTYKVHRDLPRRYQCNHCTESADQLQQLLKHQQMVHPDMLPDITVLTYEEIIPTSDKEADSIPTAIISGGHYSCKECDQTFTSKQSLESHILVKHGEPSYVCEYCSFTSGFSDMMEHSKIHVDSKLMAYQPKASGKTAPVPTPTIKQEPVSFSPPGASTPVHDPFDSAPLDLSAEPDHSSNDKGRSGKDVLPSVKKSSSPVVNKMEVDPDKSASTEEKIVQQTAAVEKKAEPEIKEAKARPSKAFEGTGGTGHGEKPTRIYKCKHCPFSSSSNFEFRTHCSFHGLSGQHPCDYCTYSHEELDNLLEHRELHADEPGFSPEYKPPQPSPKSPACPQEDEAAGPVSSPPESLYCPDCPYKTSCSSTLGLHVACHGHRLPFICDFCDFSAEQLAEVSKHRLLHGDEPDFTATVEDNALLNPEYPKDHVPGEFEAKLLDSRSSTEEATSESVPSDAQSPPFKLSITKKLYSCGHCSFVTGNRGAFDFHQSLHGGSGCYTCEQCSYRTGRWSLLLQHGRLHDEQAAGPTPGSAASPTHQDDSGEGTHSSPSSSSKTGKAELVEKHCDDSSSKSEDSPNKDTASCSNSSSASDYGSLTNGDSKNNNNNSSVGGGSDSSELRCQHCPYSTSSRSALTQHSKHHSGNGQVVCPCCDYSCASKDELLAHIQVHFTSTTVTMDSLSHMLTNSDKKTDVAVTATKTSNCKSSPGKALGSEVEAEKNSSDKSKASIGGEHKTKVYVCHFCDREFDNKDLMLKHESQHRGQTAC